MFNKRSRSAEERNLFLLNRDCQFKELEFEDPRFRMKTRGEVVRYDLDSVTFSWLAWKLKDSNRWRITGWNVTLPIPLARHLPIAGGDGGVWYRFSYRWQGRLYSTQFWLIDPHGTLDDCKLSPFHIEGMTHSAEAAKRQLERFEM